MKHKYLLVALALLAVTGLACSAPSFLARAPEDTPAPVKTRRPTFTPMPTATQTVPPSPTPLPTDTPPPTATPVPPTPTTEPPTATAVLPTPTTVPPTATPVPPTVAPTKPKPPPTKAPPKPTATPKAKHVVGSHGVSGLVVARDKTTFAVGEKAFFVYEALNHTQDPIGFQKLGIKASNGLFNTSWINPDNIHPGVPFKHDDGLTFTSPGTYQVFLAICFADPCDGPDGDWEEFQLGAATITVK